MQNSVQFSRLGALLLIGVFLLAGCSGFKLRGTDSVSYQPLVGLQIWVADGLTDRAFRATLERELRVAGATLVPIASAGVVELQVVGVKVDKTVSAYSSVLQVREFNHYIELDFTAKRRLAAAPAVAGKAKHDLSAKLRAERVQVYDSRYVLGVSQEEQVIQSELRAEVARLLALRLAVLR